MKLSSTSLKRTALAAAILAGGSAVIHSVTLPAQFNTPYSSQSTDPRSATPEESQLRNPSVAGRDANPSHPQQLGLGFAPPSFAPASGRPVTETRYEMREVHLPSGEVVKQYVPVTTTRMSSAPSHYEDPAVGELIEKYKQQPEDQRDAELLEQLKQKLGEVFDRRHESQLARVAAAEKEVAEIRQTLDKRQSMKDELVERRVRELLDQPDPMRWDYSPRLGEAPDSGALRRFDGEGQTFGIRPTQAPPPAAVPDPYSGATTYSGATAHPPAGGYLPMYGDSPRAMPSSDPPTRFSQPATGSSRATPGYSRSPLHLATPPFTSSSSGLRSLQPAQPVQRPGDGEATPRESEMQTVIRLSYDLLTASSEFSAVEQLHRRKAITDIEYRTKKNQFEMLREMWEQKLEESERQLSSKQQEIRKFEDETSKVIEATNGREIPTWMKLKRETLVADSETLRRQRDWMLKFARENLQGVVSQEYTDQPEPNEEEAAEPNQEEAAKPAADEATEAAAKVDALEVDARASEEVAEVPTTASSSRRAHNPLTPGPSPPKRGRGEEEIS